MSDKMREALVNVVNGLERAVHDLPDENKFIALEQAHRILDATPPTEQTGRMIDGLLPCPICGLPPKRFASKRLDGTEFNISYYCNHNDRSAMHILETGNFGLEEYARDCWNKRPATAVSLPSRGEVMATLEQSRSEAGWSLIHQTDAVMTLLTDRLGKPVEVER